MTDYPLTDVALNIRDAITYTRLRYGYIGPVDLPKQGPEPKPYDYCDCGCHD